LKAKKAIIFKTCKGENTLFLTEKHGILGKDVLYDNILSLIFAIWRRYAAKLRVRWRICAKNNFQN
jgi:hypothetical protein